MEGCERSIEGSGAECVQSWLGKIRSDGGCLRWGGALRAAKRQTSNAKGLSLACQIPFFEVWRLAFAV